jgi:hypothetical protein
MLEAIWSKVVAGDTVAIERALAISARRAKLMGLDEPEQHDLNMIEMTLEEWKARQAENRAQAAETLDELEGEDA